VQVYVAVDKAMAGVLLLEDSVRPDAHTTVAQLQAQGFRTVLLTGDAPWPVAPLCAVGACAAAADCAPASSKATKQSALAVTGDRAASASAVAEAVGIAAKEVHAEVQPGGKAALVRAMQAAGHRVAMVGDGVNDATALAVADVGIAMGGGVDAASEAAAVVLLQDNLSQVTRLRPLASLLVLPSVRRPDHLLPLASGA
jgi:Cu2+-exporting ATPase